MGNHKGFVREIKDGLRSCPVTRRAYEWLYGIKQAQQDKRDQAHLHAHGEQTVAAFCELCQGGGFEVFAVYGTLLGAVREGGIIGHDLDVDLGIREDEQGSQLAGLAHYLVDEAGLTFERGFVVDGALLEARFLFDDIGIDVFALVSPEDYEFPAPPDHLPDECLAICWFEVDDERFGFHSPCRTTYVDYFDAQWFASMQPTVFGDGHEVVIPAGYQGFLESLYGSSWRVPDPCWNPHESMITRRSERFCRVITSLDELGSAGACDKS